MDPHNGKLPVGLIVQLVEHCTGITEVRVGILFMPEIFRPNSLTSAPVVLIIIHNCMNIYPEIDKV